MTNTNTVNALPDVLELPESLANQVGEEYTNDAREYVWLQIVRGEDDVKELVEDFIDGYELEPSADTSAIVTEFITHTMAIRRQQIAALKEAGFSGKSNLTLAFEKLQQQGVLALEDFGCCNNCGHTEATGLMNEESDRWQAYVFFHEQDTERLIETGETCLRFYCNYRHICSDEEWQKLDRAQKEARLDKQLQELFVTILVPTFAEYGMTVEWNGDVQSCMMLKNAFFFRDL